MHLLMRAIILISWFMKPIKSNVLPYYQGLLPGIGMIVVHTQSQAEKQAIASGIQFTGYGAGADIKYSSAAQKVLSKRRVEVYGKQIGGEPISLATTMDDMVQQLKAFPQQVLKSPVPIFGIFKSYIETIPFNWSGDGVDYQVRDNVLEDLSARISNLKDRNNDLQYVKNNYRQFAEFQSQSKQNQTQGLRQIQKEINQITTEINKINEVAVGCTSNTDKCVLPNETYVPLFDLPELPNDVMSNNFGMATMYFGDLKNIPFGWQLCDGSTQQQMKLPDLRGRFPVGQVQQMNVTLPDRVTTASKIGDFGGSMWKSLSIQEMPSHNHQTYNNGTHIHDFSNIYYNGYSPGCYGTWESITLGQKTDAYDWLKYCSKNDKVQQGGSHSHGVSYVGDGKKFLIVPPYAVVYFICKIN
eukprot:TRINITY_DN2167_c0_g1_i10.p1 TRINITY_DN2167_c0_g1~~TRINITY_DN2167_c0_g1_i10.p1  ORF type:complete len:413 (+),score=9.73 TRINITY_DN2167_c0_g1_i10:571-1809(+)